MRFGADRPVTLNNQNGSFSFQKTILLKCSLRVSNEKSELFKKSKAFLKIDWKHHANISEYVRGALDRKTYCFFNGFLFFRSAMISKNALRKIDATAYLSCKKNIFWRKTNGSEPNWKRLGNNLGSLRKRKLILLVRRRNRFSLRKTKVFELSWSRVFKRKCYSVRKTDVFSGSDCISEGKTNVLSTSEHHRMEICKGLFGFKSIPCWAGIPLRKTFLLTWKLY